MKRIRYFILVALLLTPMIASADTFKNGDTTYVFKEKEISCIHDQSYLIGIDNEGNYLFDNPEKGVGYYFKVNDKLECTEINDEEFYYLFEGVDNYFITKNNGKYVIVKQNFVADTFGKIKTTDTKVVDGKHYYILQENNMFMYVDEPKDEELDTYYELKELAGAMGTTFDSKQTYYVRQSNINYELFALVEEPKKEELDTYYMTVDKPYIDTIYDVLNQEKVAPLLAGYSDYYYGVTSLKNGEFILNFLNYVDDEGMNYFDYYDTEGNKIEAFQKVPYINVLTNGLYVMEKADSFVIYNDKYEIIYENTNDDIIDLREVKYVNNIHYLQGYGKDVTKQKYFDLIEYKVLDDADQTYNTEAGKNDLSIRFSGKVENVIKVYINGKELDKKHYKLTSGSVIVTLNKDYLSTLDEGTYTLKLDYKDGGSSEAIFAITNKITNDDEDDKNGEKVPTTSDNIYAYSLLLIVSLAGLALSKRYLKNN